MWVIFEGLDKAGKGTLEWEFLKATNFKHIVIDRGPAGYATFDILFGREINAGSLGYAINIADMKKCNDFIVVYCKVPADIATQRLKEHNEICPYDYILAQALYDSSIDIIYRQNKIKVIDIDTTKSIEECVEIIVEKLKEVRKGELQ